MLATAGLAAAILVLYFRHNLFSASPVVIGLQGIAALLMVWARVTFGVRSFHAAANPTEGGLVTTGPYRFIRNPIYSAILLFAWAGIAAHVSLLTILLGAFIAIAIALRIACEEIFLRGHFPDYEAYARRTPRIIPFVL
jgi:protein-S-isoprenylcysteine O-methyltransferase Ste14